MITFLLLVVLILSIILYYAYIFLSAGKVATKIDGPFSWPFIGIALEFGFKPTEIMDDLIRLQSKYGFLIRGWLANYLFLFVGDPKVAEIFFTSNVNIRKSMNYRFLEPWLGTGLLTSTGSKWKHHRKLLTPAFHFKILDEFMDTFNSNADVMIQKLRKNVDGDEFDMFKLITLYALDVICEAAMGVKMRVQDGHNLEYVTALQRLSEIVVVRSVTPWYFPDFIFNRSRLGKEQKENVRILHDMSYKVMRNRKKDLFQNGYDSNDSNQEYDIGEKKRLAFLDLLLQYNKDGGNLTEEEIREEVDTFMFEGHDTTASALTFCIWMLAKNPECQKKAYQELYEIFGDSERVVTTEDLKNMKYLECVIKETLRLYPSVSFFFRELDEDVKFTLEEDNEVIRVPAGTTVMISPFFLGRHPKYFSDPEKFDPERFSAENMQGRYPYAYAPFSAGPRNCIGQRFAMMEMKLTICKILRNFKIFPGSRDVKLSLEVILRSSGGVYVKLENRN